MIVFLLLAVGFGAYGYLQWKQLDQLQTQFNGLSNQNKSRLDSIQKAQLSLFVYHDSIRQWLQTREIKWDSVAQNAKNVYLKEIESLQKTFSLKPIPQSPLETRDTETPITILKNNLTTWKATPDKEKFFPQLLAATIQAGDFYFASMAKKIRRFHARDQFDPVVKLEAESSDLGMIFSGYTSLNQFVLQNYLNAIHQNLDFLPQAQKKLVLYFAVVGGIALFIYLLIVFQVLSYIRKNESRNELLVQMGTRDLVTGLFNRRVFEGLVGQEIERAKRKNYPVSLLFVHIESLDQIIKGFGRPACEHLLFQISEFLKKICRNYDGVYSYDRETYVILLAEATFENVEMVIKRLKKKLDGRDFYIGFTNDVIQPSLRYGFASYPQHGEDLKALVEQGLSQLYANSTRLPREAKAMAQSRA